MAGMDPQFEPMGEHALLVRLGTTIDADVNARVHALCRELREAAIPALQELVPAYASVLIRLDPAAAFDIEVLTAQVRERLAALPDEAVQKHGTLHRIPVCYDEAHGPDLAHVARVTGLEPAQVIARHTAAEYRVAMIGFAPGFPYLLGMDPEPCRAATRGPAHPRAARRGRHRRRADRHLSG